jgi:predicted amidohydrolase
LIRNIPAFGVGAAGANLNPMSASDSPDPGPGIRVALIQIASGQCWADPDGALEQNLGAILSRYDEVADDVDLAVFPELSLTGYIPLKGYDQARKRTLYDVALRCHEEALPGLARATQGRRSSLVVGLMEPARMRFEMFNSLALIEDGDVLAVHRKIHLPVEENHYFAPGGDVTVVDSKHGRISLLICYDMLFPETARIAALRGAELLCISSNWLGISGLERLGEVIPLARALEEQLHVVFVNGVGTVEVRGRQWSFYGKSRAVSANGTVLALAGGGEETVVAQLTRADLGAAADVFPLLRDRRPDTYGELVAPLVESALIETGASA